MATIFIFNGLAMGDERFRIRTWTRSTNHRVARHAVVGGYRTRPLGDEPPTMSIGGLYAPAGRVGGTPPTRDALENWFKPELFDWDEMRGQTGEFRTGRLSYGQWTLESVDYDHQSLAVLGQSGIAPRMVSWDMRFVAAEENIVVAGAPVDEDFDPDNLFGRERS